MKIEWVLGKREDLPPATDRPGIQESPDGGRWTQGAALRWVPAHWAPAHWAAALGILFLLCAGWRVFWFLTDDAYITFRYAQNSLLGFGYTWNPPPFRPVEGYTSFSWLVLLDIIWRAFRVPPPQSANWISLAFAALTLGIGARMGMRMRLHRLGDRDRGLLIFIALLGTVTNRTFLAWTSSGLETAMFNFLLTAWIFVMIFPSENRRRWVLVTAAIATLVYLTRPDGILVILATDLALLIGRLSRSLTSRDLFCALPVLAVPAHLIWRKITYGAWLPNTYYAKQVGAWPESGIRYAASFILEYAVWIWLALALVWLVKRVRAGAGPSVRIPVCAVIAIGVLIMHFVYYTFVVGGDHFEYRVYSHLVLLLFISGAWLASRSFSRRWPVVASMLLFVVLSWPIPWTHWAETRSLETRDETHVMIRPVAGRFPQPLRAYVGIFDELQQWLITHRACMRHQEHKIFHEHQFRIFPTREYGERIPWKDHPVFAVRTVGIPGWVMPHVGIIDLFGLNDYVIARSPTRSDLGQERIMAHDRIAPEGYLECFQINVEPIVPGRLRIHDRPSPLTDGDIIGCEERWWSWADGQH